MAELRETSDKSPALIAFGPHLYIAWKGNDELNLMSSLDGINFGNKLTFNEFSYHGPALAVVDDVLFLAWTGTDEFALLNIMSSIDGINFGNKVTLREDSRYGPALAAFKHKLFIAWTGVDPYSLVNVIQTSDRVNFVNKRTLNENSISSPALASVRDVIVGTEKLYVGWTGTDDPHHANLMASSDGIYFDEKVILDGGNFSQPFPEATSLNGPAVCTENWVPGLDPPSSSIWPVLRIGWSAYNGQLSMMSCAQPNDGIRGGLFTGNYGGATLFGKNSALAPALAQFGPHRTYIGWVGDGNRLNVMLT